MKRSERMRVIKKSRRGGLFGIIIIFIILCMGVAGVGAAWLIEQTSLQTREKFGQPAQGLNFVNRMIYSYRLLSAEEKLLVPVRPSDEQVKFSIESGDSPVRVSQNLSQASLIGDESSFLDFLIYSGLDSHLQAGDYILSPSVSPVEIARKISDANQTTLKFGFLPGSRVEEIAILLEEAGMAVDAAQFVAWVQEPPAAIIPPGLSSISTLEGFLYPEVYELDRSTDTAALLNVLLTRFEENLTAEMRQAYTDHGLTLQEAVILASMVEKEAVVEEEQALIASVFLNRIEAGMKFESDPTVQYALGFDPGKETWWKNPLTLDDLKVDSPYNTYLFGGFPPGPICNPGLPALRSVAFPAETPYYYFRARCDGSGRHLFANSLDEHIQNSCQ